MHSDMKRQSSLVYRQDEDDTTGLGDFDIKAQLGQGTFGRVYLGELDRNGVIEEYAIKAIRKDKLIDYGQIESTLLEQ